MADLSADARNAETIASVQADADSDYNTAVALAAALDQANDRAAANAKRHQELEAAFHALSVARRADVYVMAALMLASDPSSRDRARTTLEQIAHDRHIDPTPLLAGYDTFRAQLER